MESPGKYLKQERAERNLSLGEIARITRIKEHFLKAIEEDQYEQLPSPFYVKGFLAHYARYLGMDPKGVLVRYQEYLQAQNPVPEVEPEIETPPPNPWKRMISARLFAVPVLLAILATAIYTYYVSFLPKEPLPPPPLSLLSNDQQNPSVQSLAPQNPATADEIEEEQEALAPMLSLTPATAQIKPMDIISLREARADNPAEEPARVLEAEAGTGIDKSGGRTMVTGKSSRFPCNSQKVYFASRVETPREGKVTHVWFFEGEEFQRIEMSVRAPAWTVYSYLTLFAQRVGNWRIEVREGNKVLAHQSIVAHKPTP